MVELKYTYGQLIACVLYTLNRTMVELKSDELSKLSEPIDPLNRTMVELKYFSRSNYFGEPGA